MHESWHLQTLSATSIALVDTASDFEKNLANIFNKVVALSVSPMIKRKVAQSPQDCLNILSEYTTVLSSQSRVRGSHGGHPSTPIILINNPSAQEAETLPFHRAPLQLKMNPLH